MAMTPEKLAASGTEDGIQRALLCAVALWLRPSFPLTELLFHIPNGGTRGADRKSAMIAGATMNALGVKKGIPDLCLPIPMCGYGALYIEVKKPRSGVLSPSQVSVIEKLSEANNFVAIVDTWEQGYHVVNGYMQLTRQHFDQNFARKAICSSFAIFDPSNFFPDLR